MSIATEGTEVAKTVRMSSISYFIQLSHNADNRGYDILVKTEYIR